MVVTNQSGDQATGRPRLVAPVSRGLIGSVGAWRRCIRSRRGWGFDVLCSRSPHDAEVFFWAITGASNGTG
jgi:hypothetical protein